MSVTLRKRKNADGSQSLLLDIYHNGKRRYEFLKHLKLDKGTTLTERQRNKDKLETAKKIAAHRANELESHNYKVIVDAGRKADVIQWMQAFVDKYQLKDKRNVQGVLNRFITFLNETKQNGLTFGDFSENIAVDFRNYLNHISIGEGGASYFARFKKMVKRAYKDGLMLKNPCEDVKTIKYDARKKDVLTLDEIKLINNTPCQSNEVKNAFIFSCMTGLRWCDVKGLTWKDFDVKESKLKVLQGKTQKEIWQNLNSTALKILERQNKEDKTIFKLPSADGANKTIKALIKRAGITKKITWHNSRHSFGTNLILNDVGVLTASKMLGHSTLAHTQRYIDAADEMKQTASEKLSIEI
ncbi:hypothetical protein A9P82_08880 [Arachidicoccus ginsenosidimutans]|uniref:site-specific integrase n=1 Tax=Arachidicoccus sp. BS20 TaxID=1850526 RepID=UPI0007F14CF1|nr:site-specific integrase [Arachidicoccus sp. BS20]ANI89397.1 hypothetical protein A9P82_08880 [Arachidicoccus sp. BS20]